MASVVVLFLAGQVLLNRVGSPVLELSTVGGSSPAARPGTDTNTNADRLHGATDGWPAAGLRSPGTAPAAAVVAPVVTPTSAASTVPAFTLPVPEPLPGDPYADTPERVVGRITIPAIGLDESLQQGMTLTAINRGPSHWPGTAAPGQLGNVVIAGHRTTFGRPFRDLDRLQVGDVVTYSTDAGTFTYSVTGTEVVTPEQVEIADQTVGYTSTLFACHPPGSAAYRIVTHLQLLDAAGRPVPAPAVTLTPVTVARP